MPCMWARITYLRPGSWRQDLTRLAGQGLSHAAIAQELSRITGLPFTRYMVLYHLREDERLAQDGECVPRGGNTIHTRRNVHQMLKGFGHLLPGQRLRHRESDILALLKEHGPLTRKQIQFRLAVCTLNTRGQDWLVRLIDQGLVERFGFARTLRGRRTVYRISPSVLPQADHKPRHNRPMDVYSHRDACR